MDIFIYRNPVASITPVMTQLDTKPAPLMASFSSVGPNLVEPAILKVSITSIDFVLHFVIIIIGIDRYYFLFGALKFQPDITAPGVSVIAAYSEAVSPTDIDFDNRRLPFNSISGTSMSCPHVSGVVGLIKTLHPKWSPAAIKSAIMTTGVNLTSFFCLTN